MLVVVFSVHRTHLRQMLGSVTVTGQSIELAFSSLFFFCRGRLGWFGLGRIQQFLGDSLFAFLSQNVFPVIQVPLALRLSGYRWIFVRHVKN